MSATHKLVTAVPGIGPSGADIFLREAQLVWLWVRPYIDDRVLDGAARLGLTRSRAALTRHFNRSLDPVGLAAALVWATIDDTVVERVRDADPANG